MPRLFRFGKKEMSILPLWVQLRNLPLEFWNPTALGKICSEIGGPQYMDKLTTNKERITYARIMVEVDVAKEVQKCVTVWLPNGESFEQEVVYENLARYCKSCRMVGHSEGFCKPKATNTAKNAKEWRAKSQNTSVNTVIVTNLEPLIEYPSTEENEVGLTSEDGGNQEGGKGDENSNDRGRNEMLNFEARREDLEAADTEINLVHLNALQNTKEVDLQMDHAEKEMVCALPCAPLNLKDRKISDSGRDKNKNVAVSNTENKGGGKGEVSNKDVEKYSSESQYSVQGQE
ncbi:uncharacterized protein LOC131152383 [Malania oleifera]|uniref:uncharacterized protein LOC131152383 n=1 Tax=Malania oleifera TaxID=397392 RepID=UPI0025AEA4B9|nr:uncharacterized protein LOC131152383 [Malania oleifera]